MALLNSGSFRSGFRSGSLTREALYEIYPFDDEVVLLDMPGSALRRVLETSSTRKGGGAFLQISGLKVKKEGEALSITVGDVPLEEKQLYQVAVNDFLAQGGDGYDVIRRVKSKRKTQLMIRDLLEKVLKEKQKISSSDLERRWKLP